MDKFTALGLIPELAKAVEDLGFEKPTEIQEKSIPLLLGKDTDLIALAQTGTGKTAGFGLPLIQKINRDSRQTQGLILSPTRELCLQITGELVHYSAHLKNVHTVAIYGGANIREQEKQVRSGAQIIVATPGRMKDMLKRGMIDISQIRYCILDEADEMLNMGFFEDITDILAYSPEDKNTWLFSATMSEPVSKIAKNFLSNPAQIVVGAKNEGNKSVSHEYYVIASRDRYKALKRLVDYNPDIFPLIFCRTKIDTQRIAENLIADGYNASALHGDLSQGQRDLVMKAFRNKQIDILVATDVAARGLDVDDITHVINYQLPDETEIYTHRSGRTGRAGKMGVSMVLVTKKEKSKIKQIERIIGQDFEEKEIPNGDEICRVRLFWSASELKETQVEPEIESYLPLLEKEFEDISKTELIQKLFSVEFSRFHNYYKDAIDLNETARRNNGEVNNKRFFISVGSRDGFDWKSLKDFLREQLNLGKDEITGVEVKLNFSFFNTYAEESEKIFSVFEDFYYQGRKVNVENTKDQGQSKKPKRDRQKSSKSSRRFSGEQKSGKIKGNRRKSIKSSISRRKRNNIV